jgi:RNA polymerase sigma factor (sigma-70 family)
MTDRERLLDDLRPASFAIAYRMLGSVSEAEDVVQEALLRVHRALDSGERIASPCAFVATVTTRLAINELRSARARRERYVGEWLPEPIITDGEDDPVQHAEMADSLFQSTREQQEELAARFFAAAERGDLAGLEALLAHDVELTGDGGGKVPALARPLRGRSRVAHTLLNSRISAGVSGLSLRRAEINGGPGALYLDAQQQLIGVLSLDLAGGQIRSINSIVNPEKLAHLRSAQPSHWKSPSELL